MSMRSLLENVAANIIVVALVAGGGILLAILSKVAPDWFIPVLWGFIGAGIVAVIVLTFLVAKRLPKRVIGITPETIEATIRRWLDSFQLSVKKAADPFSYFMLVITLDNGAQVAVGRSQITMDRYLVLRTAIVFSPEDERLLDGMTEERRDLILLKVNAELARARVEYAKTESTYTVVRKIPITNELTEDVFIRTLDQVNIDRTIVLQTIYLALQDARDTALVAGKVKQLAP